MRTMLAILMCSFVASVSLAPTVAMACGKDCKDKKCKMKKKKAQAKAADADANAKPAEKN